MSHRFEFYSLYLANLACNDSLSAHWAAILDFVYILVLCICGKDHEPGKSSMQSALRKNW